MRTRVFVIGIISVLTVAGFGNGLKASSVLVRDSSFEELVREPAATVSGAREWVSFSWSPTGAVGTSIQNPPLANQDGPDIGYLDLNGDPGAVTYIDTTLIEEGTYTVKMGLAHQAGREPATLPFKIKFEAVGFNQFILIGTNYYPVGTANSTQFTDISADLIVTPGQEAIGKYLRLVLVMEDNREVGTDPAHPGARYLMDNVRLEFTPTGGVKRNIWLGESSFQPTAWHRVFSDGNDAGSHRPSAPLFANQEGEQLGFLKISPLGGYAAMFQDHITIQPGTYTLSSGVAVDPNAAPLDSYLVIKCEAVAPGSVELIGDPTFITPDLISNSSLTRFSNTVTIPVGSPLVGRTLRSVLAVEGAEANDTTFFFDNVRIEFTPDPSLLTADFNDDGFVDGNDLALWKTAYGQTANGDSNSDTLSDGTDFLEWQRQYTGPAPGVASGGAVPEPAKALLIVLAGLAAPMLGRRRTAS